MSNALRTKDIFPQKNIWVRFTTLVYEVWLWSVNSPRNSLVALNVVCVKNPDTGFYSMKGI